jgi:hypothetical protein
MIQATLRLKEPVIASERARNDAPRIFGTGRAQLPHPLVAGLDHIQAAHRLIGCATDRGWRYFCCWGIGHVISALHMP